MPLQVLDPLLLPVLHSLASTHLQPKPSTHIITLDPPVLISSGVYLPSIRKILPDDRKQVSEAVELAAKHNDTKVDLDLWNKRITAVFQYIPVATLDFVRSRLMLKLKYKLLREFFRFLCINHGPLYTLDRVNGRKAVLSLLGSSDRQGGE